MSSSTKIFTRKYGSYWIHLHREIVLNSSQKIYNVSVIVVIHNIFYSVIHIFIHSFSFLGWTSSNVLDDMDLLYASIFSPYIY